MEENIHLSIKISNNQINVKKWKNRDKNNKIRVDLINNFLWCLNQKREKGEKYNDSIIISYIKNRLEIVLWRQLPIQKESFTTKISTELEILTPDLKEHIEDIITKESKKIWFYHKSFGSTKKEKINIHQLKDKTPIYRRKIAIDKSIRHDYTEEEFRNFIEKYDEIEQDIKVLCQQKQLTQQDATTIRKEIGDCVKNIPYNNSEGNLYTIQIIKDSLQHYISQTNEKIIYNHSIEEVNNILNHISLLQWLIEHQSINKILGDRQTQRFNEQVQYIIKNIQYKTVEENLTTIQMIKDTLFL